MTTAPRRGPTISRSTLETRSEIRRAERRLATLERLADMAQAMRDAVADDGTAEAAESLDKLSREVSLTVALKEKLQAALAARVAGQGSQYQAPAAQDADLAAFAALCVPRPTRLH